MAKKFKHSFSTLYKKYKQLDQNKIYTTNEILEHFNYSYFSDRIKRFFRYYDTNRYPLEDKRKKCWKVKKVVAITYDEMSSKLKEEVTMSENKRGRRSYVYNSDIMYSFHMNSRVYFLVDEQRVHFWQLEKFGGYL